MPSAELFRIRFPADELDEPFRDFSQIPEQFQYIFYLPSILPNKCESLAELPEYALYD
jgi:hypothetical protein